MYGRYMLHECVMNFTEINDYNRRWPILKWTLVILKVQTIEMKKKGTNSLEIVKKKKLNYVLIFQERVGWSGNLSGCFCFFCWSCQWMDLTLRKNKPSIIPFRCADISIIVMSRTICLVNFFFKNSMKLILIEIMILTYLLQDRDLNFSDNILIIYWRQNRLF